MVQSSIVMLALKHNYVFKYRLVLEERREASHKDLRRTAEHECTFLFRFSFVDAAIRLCSHVNLNVKFSHPLQVLTLTENTDLGWYWQLVGLLRVGLSFVCCFSSRHAAPCTA